MKSKLALLALPLALAACGGNRFHEAKSPNGEVSAFIARPSGSMAPIFYGLVVKWGSGGKEQCELVDIQGYEVEQFTRVSWRDDRTVELRYGVPSTPIVDDLLPHLTTGERKCRDYTAVLIRDPSLTAAADAVVKKYGSNSGPVDDVAGTDNLVDDERMVPENQAVPDDQAENTIADDVAGNLQ